MGQVLHGSARTTEAVRRAIQLRQESVRALARRFGVSPTTVQKWRKRSTTADAEMGPEAPRSTVLTPGEEAIIVAFRRHTLLPLDDCLYALRPIIRHLSRSGLHRCLQRHGVSRLPEIGGNKPTKKRFAYYPIGYFHIDLAEVQPEEGKLRLFVAIDRTSKLAFAPRRERGQDGGRPVPARPDRGRALPRPHRADRQRRPVRPAQAGHLGQPAHTTAATTSSGRTCSSSWTRTTTLAGSRRCGE